MTELLLGIFASICAGLLFWGFAQKDRIYQYPFFMGATFTAFILPQAISLVRNPEQIPTSAIQRVLIMSSLCAAMCWVGYQFPIHPPQHSEQSWQFSSKRLRIAASFYVIIGLFFWMLVYSLPQGRALSGQSTGIITIYFFFADLLGIGLVILLLEIFRNPGLINLLALTIAMIIPTYRILFFARREDTFFVILSLALAFYFIRHVVVPRSVTVIGILLAALMIFSIGQYRGLLAQGRWDLLYQVKPVETLQILVSGNSESDPELRNAALLIENTIETGQYGWGTGYWDIFIFRWIPAQLVGADFKAGLQLKLADNAINRQQIYEAYNFYSPVGSTSTGIGDSFSQFDYFGSFVFAALAIFFKYLWIKAANHKVFIAQAAYMLLSVKAMLALTHNTANFPSDLIYYALFSLPLIFYSRKIKPTNYKMQHD
jgi:hypothetical protein